MNRIIILFLLLSSLLLAQQSDKSVILDINNLRIRLTNYGQIFPDEACASWNLPEETRIVYDQSIGLTGKINNSPVVAFPIWKQVYSPGPLINGRSLSLIDTMNSDQYNIYKITPGSDTLRPGSYRWPENFGAPVKNGFPYYHGDQMVWTVYGFDTSFANHQRYPDWENWDYPKLPIEIQQLAYEHAGYQADYQNILNNVTLFEWTIINKGNEQIDSAYISLFSDVDLMWYTRHFFAVDTSVQTGYLWPRDDSSEACGYTLLYGPKSESPGSNAVFKGNLISGYKNLPLSSYLPIDDDGSRSPLSPPYLVDQARNAAQGLMINGDSFIDPVSSLPTKFPFAGDPTAPNYAWQQPQTGGGAGFIMYTGPFTLAPNDTQWVMFALVPGYGVTNKESIREVLRKANYLRSLEYDELAFSKVNYDSIQNSWLSDTTHIADTIHIVNPIQKSNEFTLKQNYPNPFNPYTNIVFTIPADAINVPVQLKVYDVLGSEVAVLLNEEKSGGEYKVKFDGSNLVSGMYMVQLKAGEFLSIKKVCLVR